MEEGMSPIDAKRRRRIEVNSLIETINNEEKNWFQVTTVPSCGMSECCGKWFHQQCLRKYAVNAGSAFMCPLCRNKNYADFARQHGIYVPE